MDGKHTAGPWVWGDDDNLYPAAPYAVYRAHRDLPDDTPGKWDGDYPDRPEAIVQTDSGVYGPDGADRPLIAAAPDLLAALKEMRQVAAAAMAVIEQCGLVDAFVDRLALMGVLDGFGVRADSALAKAEGTDGR